MYLNLRPVRYNVRKSIHFATIGLYGGNFSVCLVTIVITFSISLPLFSRRNESLVSIATTDTALDSFITKKELSPSNDTACEDAVATNLRTTECII